MDEWKKHKFKKLFLKHGECVVVVLAERCVISYTQVNSVL